MQNSALHKSRQGDVALQYAILLPLFAMPE
jgi:hypothetical protein